MIHDTQIAQISQKQDERNIYVIMKTLCPPGYHHNDFVATHAIGHIYSRWLFFFKSVIFRILQIFNGLLQTKSVKKYIITE